MVTGDEHPPARPAGRFAVILLVLAGALVTAGWAGAVVIPAAARVPVAADPEMRPTASPTAVPTVWGTPGSGTPIDPAGSARPPAGTTSPGGPLPTPHPTPTGTGPLRAARPADTLIPWAARLSPKVGIPPVALQAYGYAELVAARTAPACHLRWTTLAALGKVESDHGRANGAKLGADGRALPPIVGPALNGAAGVQAIRDTDAGALDGDGTWDRAVGPMQFIPATWLEKAADADADGQRDPHDIDDAALAAAGYLCGRGRNMSVIQDWWAAILSYNAVQPYAHAVHQAANAYGVQSHT